MNKPKLNQPDVEQSTTFNNEIDNIPFGKTYSIETQEISCSKYPLKNYKLNQPIDYLQELKKDVSTREHLTPFQKRCFEQIEKALNQPDPTIKDVRQEWEDDGYTWEEDKASITIYKENPLNEEIVKEILIYKYSKAYECYNAADYESTSLPLTLQEHIRLTKTFKAKGWEV